MATHSDQYGGHPVKPRVVRRRLLLPYSERGAPSFGVFCANWWMVAWRCLLLGLPVSIFPGVGEAAGTALLISGLFAAPFVAFVLVVVLRVSIARGPVVNMVTLRPPIVSLHTYESGDFLVDDRNDSYWERVATERQLTSAGAPWPQRQEIKESSGQGRAWTLDSVAAEQRPDDTLGTPGAHTSDPETRDATRRFAAALHHATRGNVPVFYDVAGFPRGTCPEPDTDPGHRTPAVVVTRQSTWLVHVVAMPGGDVNYHVDNDQIYAIDRTTGHRVGPGRTLPPATLTADVHQSFQTALGSGHGPSPRIAIVVVPGTGGQGYINRGFASGATWTTPDAGVRTGAAKEPKRSTSTQRFGFTLEEFATMITHARKSDLSPTAHGWLENLCDTSAKGGEIR